MTSGYLTFPSTAKKSPADLFTRGNGVDALVPVIALQVRQGSLPTRAVRHNLWSQRARAAFTLMTEHFAIMVTAGELPVCGNGKTRDTSQVGV